jgi:hypothetical protein
MLNKFLIFSIAYPPFPTHSSISNEIVALLLWIIETPIVIIANVFITAFTDLGQAMGSSADEIAAFPGQIFSQTVNSFKAYGIFAPIIAAAIWGVAILILVFFVFKIIQVSGDEITNEE